MKYFLFLKLNYFCNQVTKDGQEHIAKAACRKKIGIPLTENTL